MNGRPNGRNRAAISNFSGVVWTLPNNHHCHIDRFIATLHFFVFLSLKTCSVTLKAILYEVQ